MRTLRLLAPLASLVLLPALTAAPSDMALTSADGFALKGTLSLPAAKGKIPVVILAHQFGAGRPWPSASRPGASAPWPWTSAAMAPAPRRTAWTWWSPPTS